MTRWRFALLAALAAFALSGCLRFTADVTLAEDNTASGAFVVAVKKGTGEQFGMTDRALSEEIWSDYPVATAIADADLTDYRHDGYVGIKVTFSGEPLASFAPTPDAWGIARVGDEFLVSGPSNATTSEAEATITDSAFTGDLSQLDDAELTVTVTFPGKVTSTNGTTTGKTVSWNLQDGPEFLEARGAAISSNDPAVGMAYVVCAVLALGAAAYALAGRMARRL